MRQCHPSVRAATPLTLARRPLPSTPPALVHSDYQRLHSAHEQGCWSRARHTPRAPYSTRHSVQALSPFLRSRLSTLLPSSAWSLVCRCSCSPFPHSLTHSLPLLLLLVMYGRRRARCTSDHSMYSTDQPSCWPVCLGLGTNTLQWSLWYSQSNPPPA